MSDMMDRRLDTADQIEDTSRLTQSLTLAAPC